jgi:hypothetical protein
MHMVVLPNTLPAYLEQGFISSKLFIGLKKIVYYLKYGKTGFTLSCFSGPSVCPIVSIMTGRHPGTFGTEV